MSVTDSVYKLFAVCPPGLEEVLRGELEALGLPGYVFPGGVEFSGCLSHLYKVNLWLRTASRVLVRVCRFKAADFSTLVQRVQRYPWELYLHHADTLRIRVSTRACRLYHTRAVAERVLKALEARLGRPFRLDSSHEDIQDPSQPLLVVRGHRDHFVISVDSSGPHLHRRGYRLVHSKASIRENLAAGILLLSKWKWSEPLIDPFCGAGTIPIEAALMAAGMAPGAQRGFAFQYWRNYDPVLWEGLKKASMEGIRSLEGLEIMASDLSGEAVKACLQNADRAGVSRLIKIQRRSAARISPLDAKGLLVTNPPYGRRVRGRGSKGEGAYEILDHLLTRKLKGWRWAVLCPKSRLAKFQRRSRLAAILSNGGIRVGLWVGPPPQRPL